MFFCANRLRRSHPRKVASVNRELIQQWATQVWGPLGDVVNADAWLNNLEKFAQLAIADAELEAYQLGYQAGLHRSKQ